MPRIAVESNAQRAVCGGIRNVDHVVCNRVKDACWQCYYIRIKCQQLYAWLVPVPACKKDSHLLSLQPHLLYFPTDTSHVFCILQIDPAAQCKVKASKETVKKVRRAQKGAKWKRLTTWGHFPMCRAHFRVCLGGSWGDQNCKYGWETGKWHQIANT